MKNQKNKKSPVSILFSALGTILLILLIVACLPLTVPRLLGFELYTVISGSMEPEIPVGSLVFVKDVLPEDVAEKEVIAFYGGKDSNAIITHRVEENNVLMGQFITKGDANADVDINPVDYDDLIGRVELSIPQVGTLAQFLTSMDGKLAAAGVIVASMIMHLLASLFDKRK